HPRPRARADAGPGRPRPHGSTSRVACGLGRAPTRSVRSLPRADRRGSVARALGRRSLLVARRVGWLVTGRGTPVAEAQRQESRVVALERRRDVAEVERREEPALRAGHGPAEGGPKEARQRFG